MILFWLAGKAYSVRTFIEKAFKLINIVSLKGKGVKEIGLNKSNESDFC